MASSSVGAGGGPAVSLVGPTPCNIPTYLPSSSTNRPSSPVNEHDLDDPAAPRQFEGGFFGADYSADDFGWQEEDEIDADGGDVEGPRDDEGGAEDDEDDWDPFGDIQEDAIATQPPDSP